MPKKLKTIFISYSRADSTWLKRLKTAIEPLTNAVRLDIWDDTRIPAGAHWLREIERALANATVAVLLVTQRFFASKFIMKKELKVVLKRHKQDGLPLVWIP